MLALLLKSFVLGLSAGLLPGPMLGLVIRETLQFGRAAGRLTALAPLITDTPIIVVSLLIVGSLPACLVWLMGLFGGCFVIWMGVDALRSSQQLLLLESGSPFGSLRRAVITNWINPHPWLFWLPVGGPLLIDAWRSFGALGLAGFLLVFYGCLVGSKLLLAEAVAYSRRFLQGLLYRRLIQASGVLLLLLGFALLWETLS